MTDNGSCYISATFACACKRLGFKHIRTGRYTPKTNGEAERLTQTALHEWAYAKAYRHPSNAALSHPSGIIATPGTDPMVAPNPCHLSANSACEGQSVEVPQLGDGSGSCDRRDNQESLLSDLYVGALHGR